MMAKGSNMSDLRNHKRSEVLTIDSLARRWGDEF